MEIHGVSTHERSIIMFENDNEDHIINIYSEALNKTTLTKEEFKNIKTRPRSSKYLLIPTDKKFMKNLSLKQQYEIFTTEANILKKITNNEINLYKTGKMATTILEYFSRFEPPIPEKIEFYEYDIIEKCRNSALIYANKYEGIGYKYDFVSQFPSIMQSTGFQIPLTQGKFTTITKDEFDQMKFYKYGLYHVKIHDINKYLMNENPDNWYTHTDMNRALELKYKIEIIENGCENALLYDTFINGSKLFGPVIRGLYKHKHNGFKIVKKPINTFWGALCQTNEMTLVLSDDEEISDKWFINKMTPSRNGKTKFELVDSNKPYETSFARIKPFIMAKSRYMISKVIEKNLDNILYCHTDGIILKSPISNDTKLGDDLGDLQFKGSSKCIIKNAIDVKFEDDVEVDVFAEVEKQRILCEKMYP